MRPCTVERAYAARRVGVEHHPQRPGLDVEDVACDRQHGVAGPEDPTQDEPAVDHFDRHLALTIAVTTGDPCDLSRVGDRGVLDLELGETARLGERVGVAARPVLPEPGETASLP